MNILDYPVIGQVKVFDKAFSLLYIPMMSDEKWKQLSEENAVHNYVREHGREPESVEAAVKWQKKRLAMLET